MHLLSPSRLLIAASLLTVFWSTSALAAASVSIIPFGDKSYSVQGSGMSNVAGIQLDITYDAASLTTPTVTQGALVSGAMLAANTNIPGIIKVAIISTRAFSASGQIATINFATQQGSGGITSAKVSMIDSKGAGVAAAATYSNGPGSTVTDPSSLAAVPFSQPSQSPASTKTAGTPTTTTPVSSSTTPTYLGTVTLPAELQQQADTKPTPSSTTPGYGNEPQSKNIQQAQLSDKPSAVPKPEETPQYVAYKGVTERFKQYKGEKKLSEVAALFSIKVAQTITQEPSPLLSNGKSKAKLTVDIPARISSSPNFAVNGGTLISFKQDKGVKGRWIVEVLPEIGSAAVTMTIIAGSDGFEYPLTVAQPLKTTLTLDENGWSRFLKEVGTAKAPLHDLNNDGVRNYMDEYIFIANYLANKKAPAKADAVKKPKKK